MSRAEQNRSEIERSRDDGFERSRWRSSARRSRPFDAQAGRNWVALLKRRDRRAARLQGCQFSRALCPGLVPRRECSETLDVQSARGVVRGSRLLPRRGGGPDALATPTGLACVSESSDADQTRPPADQARVAIEATKPRLRAGRIGSCLSDNLARDESFDRRWPGQ